MKGPRQQSGAKCLDKKWSSEQNHNKWYWSITGQVQHLISTVRFSDAVWLGWALLSIVKGSDGSWRFACGLHSSQCGDVFLRDSMPPTYIHRSLPVFPPPLPTRPYAPYPMRPGSACCRPCPSWSACCPSRPACSTGPFVVLDPPILPPCSQLESRCPQGISMLSFQA